MREERIRAMLDTITKYIAIKPKNGPDINAQIKSKKRWKLAVFIDVDVRLEEIAAKKVLPDSQQVPTHTSTMASIRALTKETFERAR